MVKMAVTPKFWDEHQSQTEYLTSKFDADAEKFRMIRLGPVKAVLTSPDRARYAKNRKFMVALMARSVIHFDRKRLTDDQFRKLQKLYEENPRLTSVDIEVNE